MTQKQISLKSLLEKIEQDDSRSIIITLPATVSWDTYEEELAKVADGKHVLNFRVPNFPKNVKIGDRCYVAHKGLVMGWMNIVGMTKSQFTCEVTGKKWSGCFIQRSGKFHYINERIPIKGFQGFRYFSLHQYRKNHGLDNNNNEITK